MKLENIKNMSDEYFIELVKNMIREEKTKEELPDNIIYVSPEKFKRILNYNKFGEIIIGAGIGGIIAQIIAIISINLGASNDKATIIAGISWPVVTAIWIFGTHNDDKKQKNKDAERFKRRKIEIETELKNNILNLKKSLEKLSDEEFNLLVDGINLINENKFDNELIKKSNVLVIANKLIELNATDLLKEFDDEQNENNVSYKYNDGEIDLGYSKIKGN